MFLCEKDFVKGFIELIIYDILVVLGLFFAVIISASIVASIFARVKRFKSELFYGVIMQFSMLIVSLVLALIVTGNINVIGGFYIPSLSLTDTLIIAVVLGLIIILGFITPSIVEETKPPIELNSLWEYMLLALFIAPVCEEIVFRGLIEGYILYGEHNICFAVALPAILFSIIHVAPYRKSCKTHIALIVILALIIGVLAGYYRAVTGSILIAIIIHTISNTPGIRYFIRQ